MSLENKFDQAKGAVKEGVGKVTGDNKTCLLYTSPSPRD